MNGGNAGQALQRLDAALRLFGLGGLCTKAAHEIFQMCNLQLLCLERLILLRNFFGSCTFEIVVVPCITIDDAVMDMGDAVDGGIEKFPVMRDQQNAAGVTCQILLKPEYRFQVEVIGRLIEQQQIGPVHQCTSQVEAHAPAAGETIHPAFQAVRIETQSAQKLCGTRRCAVTIYGLEMLLGFKPRRIMLLLRQNFL